MGAGFTSLAWLPGGEAFYFTRQLATELVPADEREYHRRVWLHRVATDAATDVMVFGDGGTMTDWHNVSTTADGRWVQVESLPGGAQGNDVWLADPTAAPDGVPR